MVCFLSGGIAQYAKPAINPNESGGPASKATPIGTRSDEGGQDFPRLTLTILHYSDLYMDAIGFCNCDGKYRRAEPSAMAAQHDRSLWIEAGRPGILPRISSWIYKTPFSPSALFYFFLRGIFFGRAALLSPRSPSFLQLERDPSCSVVRDYSEPLHMRTEARG